MIELNLTLDDHGPRYLESSREANVGDIAIFGVPFDGTTSFRPGTRFGPDHIRTASIVLESYSPDLDLDLADIGYCDLGNLEVPMGPPGPMTTGPGASGGTGWPIVVSLVGSLVGSFAGWLDGPFIVARAPRG